ncbi:MAG: cell division protein [Caulobacterales bacterium]|nr:cell division protein [Caulobacterales bacterium]
MNLFARRIRGFRLVDLVALGLLMVIILGVYLAKTMAGRERAEIASVEKQIGGEKDRIRLLQAEVAHLEQPGRIERLSVTYLGLKPVSVKNEASVDQLIEIAHAGPPPKAVAPSAVAALVNGADVVPGVPPPAPAEAQPVRLAAAQPQAAAQ